MGGDQLVTSRLTELVKADHPTLEQALGTFLSTGLTGRKEKTVDWYRKRLKLLVRELGNNRRLIEVMEPDLLDWVSDLENRSSRWGGDSSHPEEEGGLSTHSLHGYVRAVRAFFKWLHKVGLVDVNPAKMLDLPKLPKIGRKGITEENLMKILNEARGDVRDYAILRFLESTGCRLGGIVNLTMDGLNIGAQDPVCRRAHVVEKGDKGRSVFMTPKAYTALLAWLEARPDGLEFPHVFMGRSNGRPWKPFTENGVYGIVKRYARKAGVKENWSPHQWRHRFARRLLQQGLGLSQVSQIMGHENVEITVKYYGQFAVGQLQDSYDKFMPDLD